MMRRVSLFIVIFLCQFGLSLQECQECKCCRGWEIACDSKRKCSAGCIDGYYGESCTNECLENCKTCENGNSCKECKPGYFNSKCNARCGKGCLNNTCEVTTGRCTCKSSQFQEGLCEFCVIDKYGADCNFSCPVNCSFCNSATSCSLCNNDLFYGTYCQYKCSHGCIDGLCNKAQGRCRRGCKPGFRGDFCNTCTPGLRGDYCNDTCEVGSYGDNCLKLCRHVDIHCQQCVSNEVGEFKKCIKCNPEYSLVIQNGQNQMVCYQCPDNCKDKICNASGLCTSGCLEGKWGEKCSSDCRTNCQVCSQIDGQCLKYEQEVTSGHGSHTTGALIGAIFGAGLIGIAAGIAIMFAFIIWRQRIKRNKHIEGGCQTISTHYEDNTNGSETQGVSSTYETLRSRDETEYSQLSADHHILPPAVDYDYCT